MPAEVESMMYVGERPWHGEGVFCGDQEISSQEAIIKAGLNWEVEKKPMVTMGDNVIVPEHYAIVRDFDNKVLGVVQDRYEIVQNSRKFNFIDAILGEVCHIHTAGSLKGGKVVWILAKLAGLARIKNTDDTIERFLLLSSAHDGSMAVQAQFTPVRVVCQNTLNYAMDNRTNVVKVRHTRNAESALKMAEKTIKEALDFYETFEVRANWLADQKFNDVQMNEALKKIFNVKEEVASRTQNTMNKILNLVETGRGNAQWSGTAWGFLNAVSEFADHEKIVRQEDKNPGNRLFSNWFGSSADIKQRSFNIVNSML